MFTGIVRAVGEIVSAERRGEGVAVVVDGVPSGWATGLGDSIAVDGVCLTAEEVHAERVHLFVSAETLAKTTADEWRVGRRVHLEPAVRAGEPLGGHIVQGHVDAVGTVLDAVEQQEGRRVQFSIPPDLRPAIFPKGSVAIDGVSLTINDVDEAGFEVQLIPHTLACTHFRQLTPGRRVNVEGDPISKQVAWVIAQQRAEGMV